VLERVWLSLEEDKFERHTKHKGSYIKNGATRNNNVQKVYWLIWYAKLWVI